MSVPVPEGAPPGTLLGVPFGERKIKVRVPDGVGAGSTIVITQMPDGELDVKVGEVVSRELPAAQSVAPYEPSSHSSPKRSSYREPVYERQQPVYEQQPPVYEPPYEAPIQTPQALEAVAHTVRLETTVGVVDIIVRPDWAPHGTRRFLELAAAGDLNELAFYRAIKGCIVQFGLPAKRPWPPIPDDAPTGVPFLLGAVSFAAVGENSRKSTLFICVGDMSHCLGQNSWESPIGAVAESSLDVLDRLETVYGDIAEFNGSGPDTTRINTEGDMYLHTNFPLLTWIRSAYPLDWQPPAGSAPGPPQEEVPQQGYSQQSYQQSNARQSYGHGVSSSHLDQATSAASVAKDAQERATSAAEAAMRAAQSESLQAAVEAAQAAKAAAQAAQMAAAQAQQAVKEVTEASQAMQRAQYEQAAGFGNQTSAFRGSSLSSGLDARQTSQQQQHKPQQVGQPMAQQLSQHVSQQQMMNPSGGSMIFPSTFAGNSTGPAQMSKVSMSVQIPQNLMATHACNSAAQVSGQQIHSHLMGMQVPNGVPNGMVPSHGCLQAGAQSTSARPMGLTVASPLSCRR